MKKLFVLLCVCFMASCSITSKSVSILDDSQCELPCWNSIIPGETSYTEALHIVTGLNDVNSDEIADINQPWKIFDQRIWFYLYQDSWLGTKQTDGAVYIIDDKVVALMLQRNVDITFGEMMEKVGEPESIISMPFVGGGDVVMAIIPSKGITFEFFAKSDDELQPQTEIDAVMFFDFAHYEDLLDAEMFSMGHLDANETRKIMYPWKGYGRIEDLYPSRYP